jgi:hypothetical protein
MAKARRLATAKPPHLPWFDDTPKKTRARRGPTPAEKRAARPRVRPLASALPRPVRARPQPAQPVKSAGLQARPLRTLIGRPRIEVPRRLAIAPLSRVRHARLAAWFAPR